MQQAVVSLVLTRVRVNCHNHIPEKRITFQGNWSMISPSPDYFRVARIVRLRQTNLWYSYNGRNMHPQCQIFWTYAHNKLYIYKGKTQCRVWWTSIIYSCFHSLSYVKKLSACIQMESSIDLVDSTLENIWSKFGRCFLYIFAKVCLEIAGVKIRKYINSLRCVGENCYSIVIFHWSSLW